MKVIHNISTNNEEIIPVENLIIINNINEH